MSGEPKEFETVSIRASEYRFLQQRKFYVATCVDTAHIMHGNSLHESDDTVKDALISALSMMKFGAHQERGRLVPPKTKVYTSADGMRFAFFENGGVDAVEVAPTIVDNEKKFRLLMFHKAFVVFDDVFNTPDECVTFALRQLESARFVNYVQERADSLCVQLCNRFGCHKPATIFLGEQEKFCNECRRVEPYAEESRGYAYCALHARDVDSRSTFVEIRNPFTTRKRLRAESV